jgi:hypothetical protein
LMSLGLYLVVSWFILVSAALDRAFNPYRVRVTPHAENPVGVLSAFADPASRLPLLCIAPVCALRPDPGPAPLARTPKDVPSGEIDWDYRVR